MSHVLHTVVVSYNRPELLERTLQSYWDAVTLPATMTIVDNCSKNGLREWLIVGPYDHDTILLDQNRYPGYASNRGFEMTPDEATLLHRSDNDMEYQPGWCDEVVERFQDPTLGQLGLRTLEEEGPHPNVGGNAIFRRELWDAGLRYSEEPWSRVPFEDSNMSQQVHRRGYRWERVQKPCALHIGIASSTDPYYQETFAARGITFEEWGVE